MRFCATVPYLGLWAPHDGAGDAEVQCTAMLEGLMVPEVGVEIPPQLVELSRHVAGLQLKAPPGDTPTGFGHACVVPPDEMVSAAFVRAVTPRIVAKGRLDRFSVRARALSGRSRASLWRSGDDHSRQARSASLLRVW